jgi:dihydrofolate reductase
MLPLQLIVAMNDARVIGKAGALPWHFREDLQHFKKTTLGHAVIMGRLTFESMGKPLPGRRNLVVSSRPIAGVEVFSSLALAIEAARTSDSAPFVIGGARLYAAALPIVTDLHLTHVDVEVEGADTYFPAFDPTDFDELTRRVGEDPRLQFVQLKRREKRGSFD